MPRFRIAHFLLTFVTTTALSSPVAAESAKQPAPKPLRIDWIMRGPDLYGTEPTNVRWSLDSKRVYFRWKEPGEPRREPLHWYMFDTNAPKGAKPVRLSDKEAEAVPPVFRWDDPATYNIAVPSLVFERDGDLFRWDGNNPNPVRVTNTPSVREFDPVVVGSQGGAIVYRQGDNLFRLGASQEDGIRQLTDIRNGPAPKDDPRKVEGPAKIAETIERELFDTVRARAEEREKERLRRRERETQRERVPFYLADGESVRDLACSPDAETVLIVLDTPVKGSTPSGIVPLYVNDDGFVSGPKARPNVGWEKNGTSRCVLLNVRTGGSVPVVLPEAVKERKLRILTGKFSTTGRLAVSALSDDWHDRWVFFVNSATGQATIADTLHDDAWVDGPDSDRFRLDARRGAHLRR
jgi:hypothetical protein